LVIDLEDAQSIELGIPDDHYSPVKPDEYIRIRLYPMTLFYRERLPRYARMRQLYQLLLICIASAGAVLAFVGYSSYVPILSAIGSGITAWQEFAATAQKLARYNASIVDIENLCLWWDGLSLVEKASPMNVFNLTQMGETIINSERSSWMSTPAKEGEDGEDKEKGEDGEKKKDA
jgi:hypothetical protein